MNDKETVVFCDLVRDAIKNGQPDTALSLLNEKIKRCGMRLSEQVLSATPTAR